MLIECDWFENHNLHAKEEKKNEKKTLFTLLMEIFQLKWNYTISKWKRRFGFDFVGWMAAHFQESLLPFFAPWHKCVWERGVENYNNHLLHD